MSFPCCFVHWEGIVPGQVLPINISQKIHTVPFGINYHFVGGGGAPVRAQWA